ncbi:MAG: sensor histidine kinase [Sphingomonadales bacterium]
MAKARRPLWLNPGSLTGRLLMAAGLWTLLALGLGGVMLSAVFRDFVESEFDERLVDTIDSMVGASEVASEGYVRFLRPLSDQRFVQPYSGFYWQVSKQGEEPFRSRSLWDQELASTLSQAVFDLDFREGTGPDGQLLRIAERDILLPGSDSVFRYMAAADISEMRAQIARFDTIVVGALTALGAGLLLAMVLQVTFGLYPLNRLRSGLHDIRSGKTRRLDPDVPPEIEPLVKEVNAVLDYNDRLVERARTHVGNLAHAVKTPLSVIINELDKVEASDLSRLLVKQTDIIRHQVEHHLIRARAMARGAVPGVRTRIEPAVRDIVRSLNRIVKEKEIAFEVDVPEDLTALIERQDMDELLGNLLENATKWCRSKIRVSGTHLGMRDGQPFLCIDIEDDGPGVKKQELETLFERGTRLDESKPGTGLGLAIVRDITEMCGGSINLARAGLGGLRVSLTLPAWQDLP